jgi:hypothetical protein
VASDATRTSSDEGDPDVETLLRKMREIALKDRDLHDKVHAFQPFR